MSTGNVNFRAFIKAFKPKYTAAYRMDKPKVAGEVVGKWRAKTPPGRFLVQVQTPNGDVWSDVGDRKARQKTSQSLRERDGMVKVRRREQTTGENMGDSASDGSDSESHEVSTMSTNVTKTGTHQIISVSGESSTSNTSEGNGSEDA